MTLQEEMVAAALRGNAIAAQWLEDEIERRGRWGSYLPALVELLHIYGDRTWYDWDRAWGPAVWALLRATPEQRARAFLVTTENPG